jgi:hypothetical protein
VAKHAVYLTERPETSDLPSREHGRPTILSAGLASTGSRNPKGLS